jgi:DNA-binding NtrC family response regulator
LTFQNISRVAFERFSIGRGGAMLDVNDAALEKLTAYSWSGNVRELENAIYRAVVLCENAALSADDFALPPPKDMPQNSSTAHPFLRPDGTLKTIEDIENDAIDFALSRNGQNMTEAAKSLGMAKSTLYRKMRE